MGEELAYNHPERRGGLKQSGVRDGRVSKRQREASEVDEEGRARAQQQPSLLARQREQLAEAAEAAWLEQHEEEGPSRGAHATPRGAQPRLRWREVPLDLQVGGRPAAVAQSEGGGQKQPANERDPLLDRELNLWAVGNGLDIGPRLAGDDRDADRLDSGRKRVRHKAAAARVEDGVVVGLRQSQDDLLRGPAGTGGRHAEKVRHVGGRLAFADGDRERRILPQGGCRRLQPGRRLPLQPGRRGKRAGGLLGAALGGGARAGDCARHSREGHGVIRRACHGLLAAGRKKWLGQSKRPWSRAALRSRGGSQRGRLYARLVRAHQQRVCLPCGGRGGWLRPAGGGRYLTRLMLRLCEPLERAQSRPRRLEGEHKPVRGHLCCWRGLHAVQSRERVGACDARLPWEAHSGSLADDPAGGCRLRGVHLDLRPRERELVGRLDSEPRAPLRELGSQPAAARQPLHGLRDGEVGSRRPHLVETVEGRARPRVQPRLDAARTK
mmetsp:Transcript_10599/g.34751  ORF Transcript_10599/g.34751 Transcript_10599/m.34751 type:complete len:496 (+) Transcript_10599:824-2311(+)